MPKGHSKLAHLPIGHRFKGSFEPLVRRCSFFQERVEIVRWIAIFQHPFERRIGIRLAAVGAQGLVVVHPGHHDDLRIAVEPIEQPILLEEFRTEPVLAVIAECAALPKGGGTRIYRYGLGDQLEDGGQPFRRVFLAPGLRIACLTRLDLFNQPFELIQKERMRINRPSVYDKGRPCGHAIAAHSSSSDSGASRSMSTSPTSAARRSCKAPSHARMRSGCALISASTKSRKAPSTGSSSSLRTGSI